MLDFCDDIPTYVDDPYESLGTRHKLDYTYSFETVSGGGSFIVRDSPRNMFFSGPDPEYKPKEECDWDWAEYDVGDDLHENAIATPISLFRHFKKKMRNKKTYSVCITEEVKLSLALNSMTLVTRKRKKTEGEKNFGVSSSKTRETCRKRIKDMR